MITPSERLFFKDFGGKSFYDVNFASENLHRKWLILGPLLAALMSPKIHERKTLKTSQTLACRRAVFLQEKLNLYEST